MYWKLVPEQVDLTVERWWNGDGSDKITKPDQWCHKVGTLLRSEQNFWGASVFYSSRLCHQKCMLMDRWFGVFLQCVIFSLLPESYELNSSSPPCVLYYTNFPSLKTQCNGTREAQIAISATVSHSKPFLM